MLTKEQIAHALPAKLKNAATQELADRINNCVNDPIMAEAIRDNFMSYTKVLQEGRFKTEDYLNAVKFVSYKLMNYTDKESYFRTFPDKHQEFMANGTDGKTISAYVSMYKKGKLVNLIMEQALVPSWVLNQAIHQKAINRLASLMSEARSEMVQMQAANALLTHLKKPEAAGPLVNIEIGESSGLNELKATMADLAATQKRLIASGVSPKEIAAQKLIRATEDAEVVE